MARLLTADGVDIWGFAARRLTEKLVAAADLVLTMETGHRTAVVQTLPQALSRTFTLREFAHLVAAHHEATSTAYLGADPATRLRELTAVAAERRARRVGPRAPNRTSTTLTARGTPPTPARMPRSAPPSMSSLLRRAEHQRTRLTMCPSCRGLTMV